MIPTSSLHAVALFAILAFVFAYLYRDQREARFALWGFAWVILFVRHLLAYRLDTPALPWLWVDALFVLGASALILLGSLSVVLEVAGWSARRFVSGLLMSVFLASLSIVVAELRPASSDAMAAALGFSAACWIGAGWLVDRYGRGRMGLASFVAGLAFVLWGFSLPFAWVIAGQGEISSWWPLTEFVLHILLAVGMIFVAIQESRMFYSPHRILDDDPNMIAVYVRDRLVFGNRALRRRIGWNPEAGEAENGTMTYVAPGYRSEAREILRRLESGEKSETGYELEILDQRGERVPVTVFGDRISWKGRPAAKFELIDMTVQRQAEARVHAVNAELQKINEELEASSRLKSEFLSNTSHELKTPLTSIIANTEILEYEMCGPVNDEQRRILASIARNSQNLLDMISQLLDFARQERAATGPEYERVDLKALIQSVVETAQPLEAEPREIRTEIEDALEAFYFDSEKIYRVYLNLVANALKFSSEGEIVVRASVDGEEMEGSVSDEGIGIPESSIEDVFEAFQQVDASATRSYQGVGLGLAISRQLVEMHGGTIWAESKVGEGTTIRFRIPYLRTAPGRTEAEHQDVAL